VSEELVVVALEVLQEVVMVTQELQTQAAVVAVQVLIALAAITAEQVAQAS
jgi:hypothetical protein